MTDTRDRIIKRVRAEWPAYAPVHGRPGAEVPPVRDNGNTAALIDLAVDITLEETWRDLDD